MRHSLWNLQDQWDSEADRARFAALRDIVRKERGVSYASFLGVLCMLAALMLVLP